MGGGLVAVRGYADDFGFEQSDPFAKLVVRIAVKRLPGQLAGQIRCAARALIEFHQHALCDRFSLAVNRLHGYLALRAVPILRRPGTAPHRFIASVPGGMA